ncbi:hypothetical protein [Bacteroides fragilis]|uniref:hypothetical protein n=1 Tax=Bacteroides fragilis TaxID=817 RepID=UPI003219943A
MKSELIKVRVTDEERDKAIELSQLFGKKNLSEFIRYLINDLYLYVDMCNSGFDIDSLIADLEQDVELKKLEKSSPMEIHKIRMNINVLKELKKEKGL